MSGRCNNPNITLTWHTTECHTGFYKSADK